MTVTNIRELERISPVSFSGLPQGFSSTALVLSSDGEQQHLCQCSDNLLQGGWVKNKVTDP